MTRSPFAGTKCLMSESSQLFRCSPKAKVPSLVCALQEITGEWAEQWTSGCREHHSTSCRVLPLRLLPSILAANCLQIVEAEFPAMIDSFLTKAIWSSVS